MGGCVEDQPAPSRSAVVSVRASFGLSRQSRARQSRALGMGASGDRNAELTIAKLVGILERREVVRAMRSLRALERPGAELIGLCPHDACENNFLFCNAA